MFIGKRKIQLTLSGVFHKNYFIWLIKTKIMFILLEELGKKHNKLLANIVKNAPICKHSPISLFLYLSLVFWELNWANQINLKQ